ncbi:MAG: serine/threonine protein kinase, partial [Clostridia bacterium]|nr:serine/threonine protein kinase [Clostridia bacterium]
MKNLVGSTLNDRYNIIEVVGIGGMAVVYKAVDNLENRFAAIKILKDEFVKDERFRKRFLNESRAIAMLSHKNIVDVYDVNFEGDIQYIVMEFIEGRTLKEYLSVTGSLSTSESISYCKQILGALRHAHERGVVHRDIKPHNIML